MKREIQAYYLTFSQLHVYILQLFVELWVYILINLTNLYKLTGHGISVVKWWTYWKWLKVYLFLCARLIFYIGSENTKRLKVCLWF